MKKLIIALALLASTACTFDRAKLVTVLTDAQWGLSAACSQEWVPASDCDITNSGLTAAIDVAKNAPATTVKTDTVNALKAIQPKLAVDSKALPYFTYVISFLS